MTNDPRIPALAANFCEDCEQEETHLAGCPKVDRIVAGSMGLAAEGFVPPIATFYGTCSDTPNGFVWRMTMRDSENVKIEATGQPGQSAVLVLASLIGMAKASQGIFTNDATDTQAAA